MKIVVSDKFTGWDDYTQTPDPLWCVPCTWAHTAIDARVKAWRIDTAGAVEATPAVLAADLEGPLSAHVALVVPLSRQKHILPAARWGHVTVDDRVLIWGPEEAHRFTVLRWLRGLGFSEASLSLPVPRFEQFITLPATDMAHVMVRWETLSPWRQDSAYLKVACKAARTTAMPSDPPASVGARR